MHDNPNGAETMATMSASDKIPFRNLGGIASRVLSSNPMQDACA